MSICVDIQKEIGIMCFSQNPLITMMTYLLRILDKQNLLICQMFFYVREFFL